MKIRIAGTDIDGTDRIWTHDQLTRITIKLYAYDGQTGVGTVPMPDPAGTDSFVAGRELNIDEDDDTVISHGFIGERVRTTEQPVRPELEYAYTLLDANALLYGFIVYQVRPEETDVARILAFLAAYLPTVDTTWVINANTATMSAKTYRADTGLNEVITDTRELTGKNFFLHDKADGSGICAHYHGIAQDQGHLATLRISDDWSDVDGDPDTYYGVISYPNVIHNARELYNRIVGRDQEGRRSEWIVESSRLLHDVDGIKHEKIVEFQASSQAELDAKVFQYAVEHHREATTFEVSAQGLDAAAMAKWRIGDRMNIQSEVAGLPDVLSPYTILGATVTITKSDSGGGAIVGLWDVTFEVGKPIRVFRSSSGVTNPIKRPLTPFVPGGAVAYRTIWVNAQPSFAGASSTTTNITPVAGELLVAIAKAQDIGTHSWPAGWTEALDDSNTAGSSSYAYKIADGTETSVTVTYSTPFVQRHLAVLAFSAGTYVSHVTPTFALSGDTHALPAISPGAGFPAIIIGTAWSKQAFSVATPPAGVLERSNVDADSGTDSSRHVVYTRDVAAPSGSYAGTIVYAGSLQGWVGGQIVISGSAAQQPVYGQTTTEAIPGDGTTGPYATNFPYLPSSLVVYIQETGQYIVVDETDPSSGEFETDTAIPVGQTLIVTYQADGTDGTGATNPQPTPDTPATVITGTDLGWFNIRDFGAVQDDSTDDTAAWLLVRDAVETAGGGTIYVPPGYNWSRIAGSALDTGAFNAQIPLPNVSHSDPHMTIRIKGGLRPGLHPVYGTDPLPSGLSGVRTMLTGGSGTVAVFSAGNNLAAPSSGGGNNLSLVVEDLLCMWPDNPSLSFWNLAASQGGLMQAVQVSTPGGFAGSAVQPTNTNSYGVKLPQKYFSNYTRTEGLSVGGGYTGILNGERADHTGLVLGISIVCIEQPEMFFASTIHSVQMTSYQYGIRASGGISHLNVIDFSAEHTASPAWMVTVADLDDASNRIRGEIWYQNAVTGGTLDSSFTKVGGSLVTVREFGSTVHWKYLIDSATGVVIVDAGTGAGIEAWST